MSRIMYMTLAAARNASMADPRLSPRERRDRVCRYAGAGTEPSLRDLLTDPLTHAVMARDKVTANDLQAVMREARAKIRARQTAA